MSNDFSLAGYQPEQYNDEGPRYPLIYWLNTTKLGGVVGAWHTGDFATMPEPWNRVERFDNEEHGHETTSLTFVPLRMRQQWYMNLTTMQGDTVTKAIPHYMDAVAARTFLEKHGGGMHLGVRSSSQVLAMVQGIDEPVVVQTKGLVAMTTFKRPTKRSPGGRRLSINQRHAGRGESDPQRLRPNPTLRILGHTQAAAHAQGQGTKRRGGRRCRHRLPSARHQAGQRDTGYAGAALHRA